MFAWRIPSERKAATTSFSPRPAFIFGRAGLYSFPGQIVRPARRGAVAPHATILTGKPMKYVIVVGLTLLGLGTLFGVPQAGSDARARELIRTLKLSVLPKESGYLGIIGRSEQMVTVDGRALAVQSQNYYMLTRDLPINYLHWLAPDDTHILIEGGPVDYFIFHPDGHSEKVTLGTDIATGQRPVVAVPGGCWKALKLHEGASYALMANTLSP